MITLINDKEFMTCTKCKEMFLATEEYFYKQKITTKSKGTFYKLSHPCRECRKEAAKEYNRNHREQHEINRANYKKTQKYKQWIKRRTERNKDYMKKWRQENSETVNAYARNRNMHKEHDITKEELNKLYKYCSSSCMYCGMTEEEHKKIHGQRLHRDHAINDGSNGIDNCVLACKSCNVSKRNKDWYEWYTSDNPIYGEKRYINIEQWLFSFI